MPPGATSWQRKHELTEHRAPFMPLQRRRQDPGRRRGGGRRASSLASAVSDVDDEVVRAVVNVTRFTGVPLGASDNIPSARPPDADAIPIREFRIHKQNLLAREARNMSFRSVRSCCSSEVVKCIL